VGKAGLAALSQAADGLQGVQWVDKVGEISSVLGKYRYAMSWVLLLSYLAVFGLLYPRYGFAGWRALGPTALASIATLAILASWERVSNYSTYWRSCCSLASASITGFFFRSKAGLMMALRGLLWLSRR
jgi:hypothetical protein